VTQPRPAAEERRDATSEKVAREVRASRLQKEGVGSAPLLAEDVGAALRHHRTYSCPRTGLGAKCLRSPEQILG